MKRPMVAVLAMILGAASSTAMAQDGQFFVNGSLGQSHFGTPWSGTSRLVQTDTPGALRLGYLCHGPVN